MHQSSPHKTHLTISASHGVSLNKRQHQLFSQFLQRSAESVLNGTALRHHTPVRPEIPRCREPHPTLRAPAVFHHHHHGVRLLQVFLQTCRVSKAIPADGAVIRFLPGVHSLVLLEQVPTDEGPPARSTDVRPFARVPQLVATQHRRLGKAFSAPHALERSLSGVRALVDGKRLRPAERFTAVLAQTPLLPCVSPVMRPEARLSTKAFVTV